jgi:peptidoglycan/xylan/chitin deacetylase (PgdA/CDA1 family)
MKNTLIVILMVLSTIVGLTGCSSLASQDTGRLAKSNRTKKEDKPDFRWPEGKRAAISLSFDDARLSQVDRGLRILDAHDVKATFYVLPGSVEKRLAGWKKAVANGHEIANHSLTHPCSGNFSWSRQKALENYTLRDMERELDEANIAIERLLGVSPATFAYPCGQKFVGRGRGVKSYVPLIAKRFIVGRGAFNEVGNDPAFCDLAQATGVDLDGLHFEQAKQLVDQAAGEGRWLVFFGHEIGESGRQTTKTSTLEGICQYAQDPANGLWIDTVEAVGGYILKHRARRQ